MSRPASGHFRTRRRTRKVAGWAFGVACFLATLTGVVVLALLLGAVLAAAARGVAPRGGGLPTVAGDWAASVSGFVGFLGKLARSLQSSDPSRAGYESGIVGSLWLLGLVAALGIPTGIGAAVYLEEFARPGRLRAIVQTNIANLAGVPSIVYGLLGLAVFVRAFGVRSLRLGETLWAGGLTLSLLVLPVVVIATREALRAVPGSLRQAALALGATRWQVVRDHVLPSALPGILTGTILSLSRAIGETAPLLMVGAAGSILRLPNGPSSRYTALPVEIYNYAREPDVAFRPVAAGGILILLALLLTMNAGAILIRNRYRGAR